MTSDHAQRRWVRLESDGFRLDGPSDRSVRVSAEGEGFRLHGTGDMDGWRLDDSGSGLRLDREAGVEAGRTLRTLESDGPTSLLLDDGRLFRVVLCGPRDARFELTGWETGGAYLEARPNEGGWVIDETAAGTGLEVADALVLLFAAEIVRHDERQA